MPKNAICPPYGDPQIAPDCQIEAKSCYAELEYSEGPVYEFDGQGGMRRVCEEKAKVDA